MGTSRSPTFGTDVALKGYIKIAGQWRTMTGGYVKIAGQWRTINDQYSKVVGRWRHTEEPPPSLSPGTYILGASSYYMPASTSGYALFDTTEYRGRITQVTARISWGSPLIVGIDLSVTGRGSGNFYRWLDLTQDWDNRTIDHRIDTFDAGAVTEFNNGTATGFTFANSNAVGNYIKNVQLKIVIS